MAKEDAKPQLSISLVEPAPPTLDPAAFISAGIAAAERLSGARWTDYNAHDPCVTMLEVLSFALTDLGYRTSHPIGDLIASSSASSGTPPDRQPLFCARDILTTAPVTADDFRKLIYDRVRGVKNAWLRPAPAQQGEEAGRPLAGLWEVEVQLFPEIAAFDPGQEFGDPAADEDGERRLSLDENRVKADVEALLAANRPLGCDFPVVTILSNAMRRLSATIRIGPDDDPAEAVARLFLSVELTLNPPPEFVPSGALTAEGESAEIVLDGPALELGQIDSASLRPLRKDVSVETVMQAALEVPSILSIEALSIRRAPGAHDGAPALDRSRAAIERLRVVQDGVESGVDPARTLATLRHLEERRRWRFVYEAKRDKGADPLARVPLGDPGRRLARYRSIQHYFPGIYGIGRHGVQDKIAVAGAGLEDLVARRGEARQLKGYLLFFEQLLADYLAQLDNTAKLFSFDAADRTYFVRPLVGVAGGSPDDPPNIAPVLGDVGPSRHGWRERYAEALTRLAAMQDPVADRRERALDHLLARFNIAFPPLRIPSNRDRPGRIDRDRDGRIEAKRVFLEDMVDLSSRRGVGVDLGRRRNVVPSGSKLAATALERRIVLKSGLEGEIRLVEHVLLRDAAPAGVGHFSIDGTFRVSEREALLVEDPATGAVVHGVAHLPPGCGASIVLAPRLLTLLADDDGPKMDPPGGYAITMRYGDPSAFAFDILERFESFGAAKRVAGALKAGASRSLAGEGGLRFARAELPLRFDESRLSVFAQSPALEGKDSEIGKHVFETAARAAVPAHLHCDIYWLSPEEMPGFGIAHDEWLRLQGEVRASGDEGAARMAAEASRAMRLRIHRACCAALLLRRGLT